jgi:xylulokinase
MSAAHLARAAMEGATLGLAYGLRRFRELGVTPTEIRLTGGGSKSAVWRQIAADAFGVPVVCLSTAEGAALGAAIQSAHASTPALGSLEEICARWVTLDESTRCHPDPDLHTQYAGKLDRQMHLTGTLHHASLL